MSNEGLKSISPIDGRYYSKTRELVPYFSEWGFMKYKLLVEIEYFIALSDFDIKGLSDLDKRLFPKMREIASQFSEADGERIKEIESVTNHDEKAIEYFLKEKFSALNSSLDKYKEFIHFGLTSQDINNTATPLMLRDGIKQVLIPGLESLLTDLKSKADRWKDIAVLGRTHGQPATPTRLGKEFAVFVERLRKELDNLKNQSFPAKFGGATGNLNAHYVAYPDKDWQGFAKKFVEETLGLSRSFPTTQIEHYDGLAAIFDNLRRINVLLTDLCVDCWLYISFDYLKQQALKNEVGSSAMPHKVNPIDFENAEGNFGFANAIFNFLSESLPKSRLQRDLTDSTKLRNTGVAFAHTWLAIQSLQKGLGKVDVNEAKIAADLEANWAVVAEGIQTILRRENFPEPYEALKALTRGNATITRETIRTFIESLSVSDSVKKELLRIEPGNYTGK